MIGYYVNNIRQQCNAYKYERAPSCLDISISFTKHGAYNIKTELERKPKTKKIAISITDTLASTFIGIDFKLLAHKIYDEWQKRYDGIDFQLHRQKKITNNENKTNQRKQRNECIYRVLKEKKNKNNENNT